MPPRRAHTIRLRFHPDEQALYESISELARRMIADQVSGAQRFGLLTPIWRDVRMLTEAEQGFEKRVRRR